MPLFLVLHLADATKADMMDGRTCYARTVQAADGPAAMQLVANALGRAGRYAATPATSLSTTMGADSSNIILTPES
jgi:hypothetical protein